MKVKNKDGSYPSLELLKLQLFAGEGEEEEEVEDEGYTGEEEEDSDTQDDNDSEDDEDSEDADDEDSEDEDSNTDPEGEEDKDSEDNKKDKKQPKKQDKDKVTNALIEQKRENKELKARLKAIEDKQREDAEKVANEKRIQELIKEGYGEAQAKSMVESDSKTSKLEREIQKLKFEKLENKHPGISEHMDEILTLEKKSNGTLTIEEIYNAKFRTSSEYDTKKNAEAAALHKIKTGQQKKGTTGTGSNSSNKKPVKLSPTDEKTYNYLKNQRQFKDLTREQFVKNMKGGEIEE